MFPPAVSINAFIILCPPGRENTTERERQRGWRDALIKLRLDIDGRSVDKK